MQLYYFTLIFYKYFLRNYFSVKSSIFLYSITVQFPFYSKLSSNQKISSASTLKLPVEIYTNAKHIFNLMNRNINPKTICL